MTPERLGEKTNDGVGKFLNSKGFERFCWAVMIFAVLYFGSVFARMLAR